jgi:bacillithiol biosynthesis deacetylase BshB1
MGKKKFGLDVLAIGAHADDVELMAGGTVAGLTSAGKSVGVADMTDASAATRGTPDIRSQEAEAASAVMGLTQRINLGFKDGWLENNRETQLSVVALLRQLRPRVVLTHHPEDDHPDHEATAAIVKLACYKSGLSSLPVKGAPFRPLRLFHFLGTVLKEPSFCVDISRNWNRKMRAVLCYKSQFHSTAAHKFKGRTDIASPRFLEYLEAKFRAFGLRIKARYAEPFYCREIPEVQDISTLAGDRF